MAPDNVWFQRFEQSVAVNSMLLNRLLCAQFAKWFTFTWTFGRVLCKGVHYVQNVSVICSVLTLTTMSLERSVGSLDKRIDIYYTKFA